MPEAKKASPPLPAKELLAAWAAEGKPAPATQERYAGTLRTVVRVLGFDDVRRITPDDVVRFTRDGARASGEAVLTPRISARMALPAREQA